ncbi:hypothetical protein BJV78DRAFT_1284193 [Lactifluus subvellereus]|nr:hypothetical protein BJV78DRAFT_1284193 [Lactifluus subvellereus]
MSRFLRTSRLVLSRAAAKCGYALDVGYASVGVPKRFEDSKVVHPSKATDPGRQCTPMPTPTLASDPLRRIDVHVLYQCFVNFCLPASFLFLLVSTVFALIFELTGFQKRGQGGAPDSRESGCTLAEGLPLVTQENGA